MTEDREDNRIEDTAGTQSGSTLPGLFRSAVSALTGGGDEDAITLLERDHREVEALFERFEDAEHASERAQVVEEICVLLSTHAAIEEQIFYPAARREADVRDLVDEAVVEHATLKELIATLQMMTPSDPLYRASVTVLKEYVEHHVKEEERELFVKVRRSSLDLDDLGKKLEERKLEVLTALVATLDS